MAFLAIVASFLKPVSLLPPIYYTSTEGKTREKLKDFCILRKYVRN